MPSPRPPLPAELRRRLAAGLLSLAPATAQHPWRAYATLEPHDPSVPRMLTLDAAVAWLQSDLLELVDATQAQHADRLAEVLADADQLAAPELRAALRVARALLSDDLAGLRPDEQAEAEQVRSGATARPRFVAPMPPNHEVCWREWTATRNSGGRDRHALRATRRARAMGYLRHAVVPADTAPMLTRFLRAEPARATAWREIETIHAVWVELMGEPALPTFSQQAELPAPGRDARMMPFWSPHDVRTPSAPPPTDADALIRALTREPTAGSWRAELLALTAHLARDPQTVQLAADPTAKDASPTWQRVRQSAAVATYVAQRWTEFELVGPMTPAPPELRWFVEPDPEGWRRCAALANRFAALAIASSPDQQLWGKANRDFAQMCLELSDEETSDTRRAAIGRRLTARTKVADRITGNPAAIVALSAETRLRIAGVDARLVEFTWRGERIRALALNRVLQRDDGSGWRHWP